MTQPTVRITLAIALLLVCAGAVASADTIEELARFWDTHDLTDFEDELEEVSESIFERPVEETVTIHLPPTEVEAVKRIAQSRGIEHATLIREWVLEKLARS